MYSNPDLLRALIVSLNLQYTITMNSRRDEHYIKQELRILKFCKDK